MFIGQVLPHYKYSLHTHENKHLL